MKDFRRSMIRLVVFTAFLLIVAWLGLKLMQYHGDWERLIKDGQDWLNGLGIHPDRIFKSIGDAVGPKVEALMDSVRGFFGQPSA